MKLVQSLLIAVLAGAAIAGCGNKVYVQRDEAANLSQYRTYAWVDTKASQNDTKNVTAFARQSIQNAVNAELSKKGWHQDNVHPDVLISYDILVERAISQQSDPIYSQPFTRVFYNPWFRRWGTIYYPSQFVGFDTYNVPIKQGTITITMTDAKTDKAVWQAWTTESMDRNKFTSDEANHAVKNIFKKFDAALK